MSDVPDSPLTFRFPGDYTIREEAIGYKEPRMPECPTCCRDMPFEEMMVHDGGVCRAKLRTLIDAVRGMHKHYSIGEYEGRRFVRYDQPVGSGDAMIALLDALDALQS